MSFRTINFFYRPPLFGVAMLIVISELLPSYSVATEAQGTKCVNRKTGDTKFIGVEYLDSKTKVCRTMYGTGGAKNKEIAWAHDNPKICSQVASNLVAELGRSGWNCGANNISKNQSNSAPMMTRSSQDGDDPSKQLGMISKLVKGDWGTQCIFHYPNGWETHLDAMNSSTLVMLPGPGGNFTNNNFVFTADKRAYSDEEKVFINASINPGNFSWNDAKKLGWSESKYNRIITLGKINPGQFKTSSVLKGLQEDSDASEKSDKEKIAGSVDLRGLIKYEDGSDISHNQVSLLINEENIQISTLFVPFVKNNLSLGVNPAKESKENLGLEFSCKADNSMNQRVFKELCKLLIERTTLNHDILTRCKISDDGQKLVNDGTPPPPSPPPPPPPPSPQLDIVR